MSLADGKETLMSRADGKFQEVRRGADVLWIQVQRHAKKWLCSRWAFHSARICWISRSACWGAWSVEWCRGVGLVVVIGRSTIAFALLPQAAAILEPNLLTNKTYILIEMFTEIKLETETLAYDCRTLKNIDMYSITH